MSFDFSNLTEAERAEIQRSAAKARTGLIDKFRVQRADERGQRRLLSRARTETDRGNQGRIPR